MAQFDLFKNTRKDTKSLYPYLLEVQHDFLNDLKTTVVIPLANGAKFTAKPISNLHYPVAININGKDKECIVVTTLLAGVDRAILGDKVGSLIKHRGRIIGCIDFMLTGI